MTICAERAAALARSLRPTAGRWFLWGDDGGGWCRCPHCRGLSDSDQALLWEHSVLAGLRSVDPELTLAHLAYHNTLAAPTQVRPEPGIFLEYAPIHRTYDQPYAHQTGDAADALEHLDANLAVFDAATAQVLEYWLDESRFSSWRRPAVALPWRPDVMAADLATYAARGIRHATSFAVWLDEAYRQAHGEPPVAEYGQLLAGSVTA